MFARYLSNVPMEIATKKQVLIKFLFVACCFLFLNVSHVLLFFAQNKLITNHSSFEKKRTTRSESNQKDI